MKMKVSARLAQMGSAIFAEVAEWKEQARRQGLDIIDLGIGSPDGPPSERIMNALADSVRRSDNYGYPTSEGSPEFRQTVAKWYKHRFDVELDPTTEVLTLMGSQEGLAHLAMAITDPGDIAIVPNPGYPIYSASLALAGVTPYQLPLKEEYQYLPKLDNIPQDVLERAKFILLNYPSNPLSATADRPFFESLVDFARKHDLAVVHDIAYSEMAFDGYKPTSILEVPGAKEVAVEFHSLSKSFNMAGCRIAMMVGNTDIVCALKSLKSNIDYGVFKAVQDAGIVALEEDIHNGKSVGILYEQRRNLFLDRLKQYGWDIPKPKATMFVWAKIPSGWTSRQISREILFSTGVVVIPGDAFGSEGEGYVRIALVQSEPKIADAADRLGRFIKKIRHSS